MAWLLSWLWQGVALTLLVGVALRVARRLNAATRAVFWWVTLAAVLALPALSGLGVVALLPGPAAASGIPSSSSSLLSSSLLSPIVIPPIPDWLLAIAIGAWLGVALRGLLRLARSFAHLQDLKQLGEPLDSAREARLSGWLTARAAGRPATLAVADGVELPSALGFGRAVILVPRHLADDLADADLDRIVLHEYAHLERRDDWARLVQQFVLCFVGAHPAVWWIGRSLDLEREAACDDFVLARTGEPKRYATCLARVAELASRSTGWMAAALAPGAARAGRELARRVSRLLDHGQRRRPWPVAAALGAGALASVVAASAVTALGTMIMLVDAAPEGWAGGRTLRSRVVSADSVALAPRIAPTPVTVQVPPPAAPRSGIGSLPSDRDAGETAALAPGFALPGSLVAVEPVGSASPASVELDARPVAQRLGDAFWPAPVSERRGLPGATAGGPWQKVADAGAAVGMGVKSASVATGGFFGRAASSIARGF